MKAITLYHPFPELVAFEQKLNETRSWETPFRGPIAIHVATSRKPWHMDLAFQEPFFSALTPLHTEITTNGGVKSIGMKLHLGKVIAICNLVDCIKITPEFVASLSEKERVFGDYTIGRFAWKIEDVHQLKEPIMEKGKQRLWNFDETPHLVAIDPYAIGSTKIWTPKGVRSGRKLDRHDEDAARGLEVVA